MKKIFLFISVFALVVALCLCLFNSSKEYDIFTALSLSSQVEFANPLTQFQEIGNEFQNFGNIFNNTGGNWWSNFWNGTTQFFTLIWAILKAPVLLVYDLILDLISCFKVVTIFLGFY